MSVFKTLFGQEKEKEENLIDQTKYSNLNKTDFISLEELIEQNAGLSYEKQLIFGDIIGSNSWELDMNKGIISFGILEFPIQIIGSLAFNNNSWMWGWANTQSGMPENLLKQSNQLKVIGQDKNIKELTEGSFNVEEGFEHKIGLLACGLFKSNSYYCADYGQGTLVVTIDDNKIPEIDKNNQEKVLICFPQLINGTELNHKNAFQNYLIDRDFKLDISDNKIEGLKNNRVIVAEFDDQNRLKSLNAKV